MASSLSVPMPHASRISCPHLNTVYTLVLSASFVTLLRFLSTLISGHLCEIFIHIHLYTHTRMWAIYVQMPASTWAHTYVPRNLVSCIQYSRYLGYCSNCPRSDQKRALLADSCLSVIPYFSGPKGHPKFILMLSPVLELAIFCHFPKGALVPFSGM